MSAGGQHERVRMVAAVCSGCGKQVRAPMAQAGRRVRCPHCRGTVELPGMLNSPVPPASPSTEVPADRLLVACPDCEARFYARLEHAGRPTRCGKCGKIFEIPRAELSTSPAAESEAFGLSPFELGEDADGYSLSAPAAPRRVALEFPEEPRAIRERIAPDAAPRSTYFSGVFDFPFRGDAVSRWFSLTLLLTLLGGLSVTALMFVTGSEGSMGVVGAGFLGLAAMWAFILAAGFGSSCATVILEDTAAGSELVGNWPEADWRGWLYAWLPFFYIVFLAMVAGYGLRLLLALVPGEGYWLLNLVAFLVLPGVLFPILLLSGMEGGSMLVPWSAPILLSLFRRPASWLVFYLLSGALTVALLLPTVLVALFLHPLVALVYFAPVAAAAIFIYARLLGRLAWRISVIDANEADDAAASEGDVLD